MMAQAREKAERMGLKNVAFRQGDVGALPFEDAGFSGVRLHTNSRGWLCVTAKNE